MTILNLPATLAIARYRYTFTLTRTMRAPAYPGSALRGAFGHALRRACVPRGHAPSALLLQNSPYTHIFEPAPRPDIGLANPATIPPANPPPAAPTASASSSSATPATTCR